MLPHQAFLDTWGSFFLLWHLCLLGTGRKTAPWRPAVEGTRGALAPFTVLFTLVWHSLWVPLAALGALHTLLTPPLKVEVQRAELRGSFIGLGQRAWTPCPQGTPQGLWLNALHKPTYLDVRCHIHHIGLGMQGTKISDVLTNGLSRPPLDIHKFCPVHAVPTAKLLQQVSRELSIAAAGKVGDGMQVLAGCPPEGRRHHSCAAVIWHTHGSAEEFKLL